MATQAVQADVETITRSWSLADGAGDPLAPDSVTFHARSAAGEVSWTTDGADGTIAGVVDDGDGTGTWQIAAGDLAAGNWRWWALVDVGGDRRIPAGLSGELVIADR